MITPGQIKAARAMLNLSQKQLAQKANISVATLNNIERGAQTNPKISTIEAIQRVLAAKGIEFSNQYDGTGVLLKPLKADAANPTILIIDDSVEDRTLYKHWLRHATNRDYHVIEADNAKAGYGAFLRHHPDCVVLDFKMYGMDGFQLLAEMRKDHVRLPPVIFLTGLHNEVMRDGAMKQGVYAYFDKKTVTKEGLYETVEQALA